MSNNQINGNKDAFALFPDLMADLFNPAAAAPPPPPPLQTQGPPQPPDISWLKSGLDEVGRQPENALSALVLIGDEGQQSAIATIMTELGYLVKIASCSKQAIEEMRCLNFTVIVARTEFETGGESTLHQHVQGLSSSERRHIFYVLMGAGCRTLYDLEALSCSANLVVNEKDVPHFSKILEKGLRGYHALFDPLLEILQAHGKGSV